MKADRNFAALLLALLSFAILMLFSTLSVQAQNPPTITAQANTLYVSAEGKFESAPDTALVQFNIAAQESSPRAAYSKASQEAEQIRTILRNDGVDPKQAEIGFFSLQPMYDYKNPKHKVVGYRVVTNVSLKLKDFSKTGPILEQLGEQEWAENVNLNYTLENMDAAKLKAVEDAFHRARAEAETVARVAGRTVGELSYASVDTYEQPRPLMMPMARAQVAEMNAPPPTAEFTPHSIVVNARVNAVFGLK
jgi:hypothetical protein